jgi:hypothetical protein
MRDEVVELGALGVDRQEAMLDVGLLSLGLGVGVGASVAGVGGCDLAGGAREGGGEEQRLALGRGLGDDPVDRRAEAHVEHAVGLVEDEQADLSQGHGVAADQVLETAGSGDEDVGAARGGDLRPEADAAVYGGDLQPAGLGECGQLGDDLACQLPGRGQDKGARATALGLDQIHHGDAEGKRLARSGGRLDEEVAAGERIADDHLLNGERLGDRARPEGVDHRLGSAEIGKGSDVVNS